MHAAVQSNTHQVILFEYYTSNIRHILGVTNVMETTGNEQFMPCRFTCYRDSGKYTVTFGFHILYIFSLLFSRSVFP